MLIRFALILILLLTACTQITGQQPDFPIPTSTEEASYSVSPLSTPDLLQEKMTEIATRDLSKRITRDLESVRVILSEAIVWPDSALGCPRPGEVYAQGTVPGFQIQLEAGGQAYDYHTDKAGNFILCLDEELPSFPITPGEIQDGKPWVPVN